MTRWTARLALAGVSAIAAVVSYFHALSVVRLAGATGPVAYLVPFLADLVILGASAALLDASRSAGNRPRLATVSLAAGIAVTVAMNVAAGIAHGVTGALVAGWPALAFILALESLAGMVRRDRAAAARGLPEPGAPADLDADFIWFVERHSQRKVADLMGVSHPTVGRRYEAAKATLNGSAS